MAQAQEAKKVKFLEVIQSAQMLTFKLADGQSLTLDANGMSGPIQEAAMMHGFNQKVRDAAAGFSKGNDYDGAFEAMQQVIESLEGGNWNRQGGGMKGQSVLAEAIARFKGCALEAAQAAVQKATDDQKKAWAKNVKIAALMAQVVAERAAARVSEEKGDDEDLDIEI